MQSLRGEIGQHDPHRKIAGAAVHQDVLQPQPADIGCERRRAEAWKAGAVPRIEFRPPIDIRHSPLEVRARSSSRWWTPSRGALRTVARPSIRGGFAGCTITPISMRPSIRPCMMSGSSPLSARMEMVGFAACIWRELMHQEFFPQADAPADSERAAEAFRNSGCRAAPVRRS